MDAGGGACAGCQGRGRGAGFVGGRGVTGSGRGPGPLSGAPSAPRAFGSEAWCGGRGGDGTSRWVPASAFHACDATATPPTPPTGPRLLPPAHRAPWAAVFVFLHGSPSQAVGYGAGNRQWGLRCKPVPGASQNRRPSLSGTFPEDACGRGSQVCQWTASLSLQPKAEDRPGPPGLAGVF